MDTRHEQAILGIMLNSPDAFYLADTLTLEMFQDGMNRNIYEAMTALALKSLDLDIPTIISQLNETGYKNYGSYLMELKDNAPSSSNIKFYVNKLVEANSKQQMSKQALELYNKSNDEQVSVEESLSEHIIEISKLLPSSACRADSSTTIARYLQDSQNRRIEAESGSQFVGVSTGINTFDTLTRGLRKSSVTTIAAASGSYKTYFALNISTHYAKQGKSVLYFSLEMADIELLERIVPMVKPAGNLTQYSDMTATKLDPMKQQHLEEALAEYKNLNFIVDWGTRNMDKILGYAEKIKRSKQGLDMLVIDHLQLLQNSGDPFILSEYTGRLKNFAMTNNIPVILVSQFNRNEGQKVAGAKPRRSWLRGSSSIEQDSDAIIFLHREDPNAPETLLILDKFRQASFSKQLEVPLVFDSNTCTLKETIKVYNKPYKPKEDNYKKSVQEYAGF